jgi:hypothetical protein
MKQQQRLAAAENGESQQQAVGGKRTPTNCDAVVFSRFDFLHEFPAGCRWTPGTTKGRLLGSQLGRQGPGHNNGVTPRLNGSTAADGLFVRGSVGEQQGNNR